MNERREEARQRIEAIATRVVLEPEGFEPVWAMIFVLMDIRDQLAEIESHLWKLKEKE